MQPVGQLHVVMGHMFSGKTSALLKDIKESQKTKTTMMVVTHAMDTRYDTNHVVSHVGDSCEAIPATHLTSLWFTVEYHDAKAIFIDEAQFFTDLYEFVEHAVDVDAKHVYVYGLDGDYTRRLFGDIARIIPLADTVTKLNGTCAICNDGTRALFSKRMTESNTQVEIGASEHYEPVCRRHYA